MSYPREFKSTHKNALFLSDIEYCQVYQYKEDDHNYFILCDETRYDKILVWMEYKKSNKNNYYEIINFDSPEAIYGTATLLIWGLLMSDIKLIIDCKSSDLAELWIENAKIHNSYVTIDEIDNVFYITDKCIPKDRIKQQNKEYRIYREGLIPCGPYTYIFRNPYYL